VNKINQEETHRTIERVARLVAYLSVNTHDLASAEDALSNALVSALNHWPKDGVPQNPKAWLLTVARHSLIDVIRHQKVVLEREPTLKFLTENSTETTLPTSTQFPDERLKLLFVCAHPAIDPAMHTRSCCRPFWVWMQLVLLTPSWCHRRRWDSACSAQKQKYAAAVFRSSESNTSAAVSADAV